MDPLILKPTNTTFQIHLDKSTGVFEFSGRSRPENVMGFFDPIFSWFDKYHENPNQTTVVTFKLEYFNSSTAKVLLRFLVRLEKMLITGVDVKIVWKTRKNDEDMLETGQDYATLISVPFEFIEFQ
ncbi:MAG: DUF1987 domain-containing protein [Salinivirgaceae bacterium]|jgi:hypothetical protein|nr:DUF1987 domain-containing protein [Salinivirgaceae bacterium]